MKIVPYQRNFCSFFKKKKKQVTVEDPKTGDEVIFPCQRWFSTNDGDGKISRELVRDDKVEVEISVSQGNGSSS